VTSPHDASAAFASAGRLQKLSPIETLDRAFTVLRMGSLSRVGRACMAGAPLGLCVVGVYALERVEGITELRAPAAVLLTAAFFYRCVVLSRIARELVLDLRPALPVASDAGRVIDVMCSAGVVGLGLWLWLWPMALLATVSPFAVAGLLPLLALRGSIAPSWLARTACTSQRGFSVFARALDDNAGSRVMMLGVEACLLAGTVGVFANLYALAGFVSLLASSLFGVEVSVISAFLSPENDLVLLLIAVLAMILMEPLRAALSAEAFSEARGRKDGADLHAAVDALITTTRHAGVAGTASTATRAGSSVLLALLLWGAVATSAPLHSHAEDAHSNAADAKPSDANPSDDKPGQAQSEAALASDAAVAPTAAPARDELIQGKLELILAQREFVEPEKTDTRSLWKWIEKQIERWFGKSEGETPSTSGQPSLDMKHIPPTLVMIVALLVVIVAVVLASRGGQRALTATVPKHEGEQPLLTLPREPDQLLDEASALAQAGKLREALRALYVATLASLDHANLIHFEPAKTNGQYLRALPQGDLRKLFAAFTRVFDHKHYGGEPTTLQDYQHARQLADRICSWGQNP
jgi:hypothetical protein